MLRAPRGQMRLDNRRGITGERQNTARLVVGDAPSCDGLVGNREDVADLGTGMGASRPCGVMEGAMHAGRPAGSSWLLHAHRAHTHTHTRAHAHAHAHTRVCARVPVYRCRSCAVRLRTDLDGNAEEVGNLLLFWRALNEGGQLCQDGVGAPPARGAQHQEHRRLCARHAPRTPNQQHETPDNRQSQPAT